jgi:hypothetical protein
MYMEALERFSAGASSPGPSLAESRKLAAIWTRLLINDLPVSTQICNQILAAHAEDPRSPPVISNVPA